MPFLRGILTLYLLCQSRQIKKRIKMKTLKTGTALYSFLLGEFDDNFQNSSPSFGNLLWQLIVNEAWADKNTHCFVSNYDKNGLVLGIAEKNENGYHNTHVYFNSDITNDKAEDILDQLNEQMFGLLPRASCEIVLSSMRYISAN